MVEFNGMVEYENLDLANKKYQSLQDYNNGKDFRNKWLLIPSQEELSDDFFLRIQKYNEFQKSNTSDSIWSKDISKSQIVNTTFKEYKWIIPGNNLKLEVSVGKVVILPEFLNRCGYVSSYAFMINKLRQSFIENGLSLSRREHLELLYMALLQTSQIQFVFVMRMLIELIDRELKEKKRRPKLKLFDIYIKLCVKYDLAITGGPLPRYQAQKGELVEKMSKESFEKSIQGLSTAVDDMEDGLFVNKSQKSIVAGVDDPEYNVYLVGNVAALSFAPLCVFTGLSKSENSIWTAKFARINMTSSNSYCPKLTRWLQQFNPETNYDKAYFYRSMKSIATSWIEVPSSIENGCCACFRASMKWEVYFYGHDLYILKPTSDRPLVRKWKSKYWEPLY